MKISRGNDWLIPDWGKKLPIIHRLYALAILILILIISPFVLIWLIITEDRFTRSVKTNSEAFIEVLFYVATGKIYVVKF